MRYDADIIVIGAGPAGLAAAIRARWVKSSQMAPASVLLLDAAGPGGIAALGMVSLVGPEWNFDGNLPARHLFGDLEKLEIPVCREAATGLARDGNFWRVQTCSRSYSSLAVVLATGLRQLTDEPRIRARKMLTFLSGGYERAAGRFMEWSNHHRDNRLVIIGGAVLAEAMPAFRAYDDARNQLTAIYEPAQHVIGYADDDIVTIAVETRGRMQHISCEHVMLDYHSLEMAPPALAFLPDGWRTPAGYSVVGPVGDDAIPGLFAAGDCAGMPSMCVKALAQGTEAGFHAYRYVYERKFGESPHLFAFFPSPSRPLLNISETPPIDSRRHYPVGLTAQSRYPSLLTDSVESITDIGALFEEIRNRTATVHVKIG